MDDFSSSTPSPSESENDEFEQKKDEEPDEELIIEKEPDPVSSKRKSRGRPKRKNVNIENVLKSEALDDAPDHPIEMPKSPATDSLPPEPLINLNQFRKLLTDAEIANEQGIDISELHAKRVGIVKHLAQFDMYERSNYSRNLEEIYKQITPEPGQGFFIGVILHDGSRAHRKFCYNDPGEFVYRWVAMNKKLISDQIKIGHFIIISRFGEPLMPAQPLVEQLSSEELNQNYLFNIRII